MWNWTFATTVTYRDTHIRPCLLYRKAQQPKQTSSPAAILNARLRHTRCAKSLCSEDKHQQGFSPVTNNDKSRHPDDATTRVCRRNKDKHAWLEKCNSRQRQIIVDACQKQDIETSFTLRLSCNGKKLNILHCQYNPGVCISSEGAEHFWFDVYAKHIFVNKMKCKKSFLLLLLF